MQRKRLGINSVHKTSNTRNVMYHMLHWACTAGALVCSCKRSLNCSRGKKNANNTGKAIEKMFTRKKDNSVPGCYCAYVVFIDSIES